MRNFLGNPSEQEYDFEDEVDGGVVNLVIENFGDFVPAMDEDDDDGGSDADIFDDNLDDEANDPDYDSFQDNDGYDSNEDGTDLSLGDGPYDVPDYSITFSSDEEEDEELDYITLPCRTVPLETATEPAEPEPSNTESTDQVSAGGGCNT